MQTIIMIASPRYCDIYDGREEECLKALRERFLDQISSRDRFNIYQEALTAGWGLFEVRQAIDALVEERGRQSGKELPS
jgi:hypothetical protein